MRMMPIAILLLTISIPSQAPADILDVDPGGGGDYLTIQEAVDAAGNGDVISVAPGVYYENVIFPAPTPNVTLQSVAGALETIIDAGGQDKCIEIKDTAPSSGTIEGFTFRNSGTGYTRSTYNCGLSVNTHGAGEWIIRNNIFIDHPQCGMRTTDTGSVMENLFIDLPRALWISSDADAAALLNTFINCLTCINVHGQALGAHVTQCLFYDSTTGLEAGTGPTIIVDCNCFHQVDDPYVNCGPGTHDHYVNPLFCGNPPNGNYHLRSNSLCAEENNAVCHQIGAYPIGCDETAGGQESWSTLKRLY